MEKLKRFGIMVVVAAVGLLVFFLVVWVTGGDAGLAMMAAAPFAIKVLYDIFFLVYGQTEEERKSLEQYEKETKLIDRIGRAGSIHEVVSYLEDDDYTYRIREACFDRLVRFEDQQPVDAVVAYLKAHDRDELAYINGTRALGRFGARGVPALMELLADQALPVTPRAIAAEALGELKADEAVGHLVDAAQSGEKQLRKKAVRSLRRITGQRLSNEPSAWVAWYESQSG